MAEYIDKEKLRQAMFQEAFVKDSDLQRWDSGCWIRYKLFENVLEKTETADVQPVVHGRWIGDSCSNCGISKYNFISFNIVGEKEYARPFGTWLYCPNCGAKMDGES